jgi:hypothetical protein
MKVEVLTYEWGSPALCQRLARGLPVMMGAD